MLFQCWASVEDGRLALKHINHVNSIGSMSRVCWETLSNRTGDIGTLVPLLNSGGSLCQSFTLIFPQILPDFSHEFS